MEDAEKKTKAAGDIISILTSFKQNDRKEILDHVHSEVCRFCGSHVRNSSCFCNLDHA